MLRVGVLVLALAFVAVAAASMAVAQAPVVPPTVAAYLPHVLRAPSPTATVTPTLRQPPRRTGSPRLVRA